MSKKTSPENTKKPSEKTLRRNEGMRLNGHISRQATDEINNIIDEYGTNKYDILSTAVVFYAKTMRGENMYLPTGTPKRKPREAPTYRSQNGLKAIWCEDIGGKLEGNVCHFTKYELSLAGKTEAHKRSMSLADLPDSKEDFMAYVLGGYKTLKEAKEAAGEK